MQDALLGKDKEFAKILNIVKSIKRGDWNNNFITYISGKPLESELSALYFDSVKMANAFMDS